MRYFIFIIIAIAYSCSNTALVINEDGTTEFFKNGKKISKHVNEKRYIDKDLEKIFETSFGESLYLIERLNEDLILEGFSSFDINNKSILFKEKNGYSLLCLGIIKHCNYFSKFLINIDKNIINFKTKYCIPFEAAIKSNNKEMIDFLLACKKLNINQENYIQLALENRLPYVAFKIFIIKYYKNDYFVDFLNFLSQEKFSEIYKNKFLEIKQQFNNLCKIKSYKFLQSIKDSSIREFISYILEKGKLDFDYNCIKNDYFSLKNFKQQNPTYKPIVVNNQLNTLLKRQAIEKLEVAKEYLRLHPHTKYANKVRKILNYLTFKDAYDSNSIEKIKEYIIKNPNSKYRSKIKRKLEYLFYQQAKQSNNINNLIAFIKKNPNSIYVENAKKEIFNIKKRKALNYFKNKIYSGCKDFKWIGEFDKKSGYPKGNGYFICRADLLSKREGLFYSKLIYTKLKIFTNIHNKKMSSGKIIANLYEELRGLLFPSTSYIGKKYYDFNFTSENISSILYNISNSIKNEYQEKPLCKKLTDKCIEKCKYKSKKSNGFLSSSDEEKCIRDCYTGKYYCNKGDKDKAKQWMCMGMCQGLEKYNGSLFKSSTYDKCVDSCINNF